MGISWDALNCGDEVEFYVGPRERVRRRGEKREEEDRGGNPVEGLSAYQVRVLEKGSVVWEEEDEPRGQRRLGRVERMIRWGGRDGGDGSGGSAGVGTIRLLDERKNDQERVQVGDETEKGDGAGSVDDDDDRLDMEVEEKEEVPLLEQEGEVGKDSSRFSNKKGILVRFTRDDYSGLRSKSRTNLLERGDIVEFTLVTEKRSGIKYARDITLVKSERERLEEERERRILESGTLEQGIVVSLKKGFGFLKSNARREEVYFHFSHVRSSENREKDESVTLEEGQDVEFLVVTEGGKLSARNIKVLPRGSVVFEKVVAKGVTGVLTLLPRFSNYTNSSRRGGKSSMAGQCGKIRLCSPFTLGPDIPKDETMVSEVWMHPDDCQGLFKDDGNNELWFRLGDTLRFDVVRDSVDGNCRAVPTKYIHDESEESEESPKIRLVSPGLAGRAEGIVVSMRQDYGFIELAHRNVDVYFRLSEVMPLSIQKDMVSPSPNESGFHLTVGSEVTFDLSLLPPRSKAARNSSRSMKRSSEKDQLRAQRLIILPAGSVTLTKEESDVIGFVTRMKGGYTGQIRLNKKMKAMPLKQQYPLMMKLVQDFASDSLAKDIVFQDVQSEYENDIMADIVGRNAGMALTFIPVSDFGDLNRGRMRITKVESTLQHADDEDDTLMKEMTSTKSDEQLATETVVNNNTETESDADAGAEKNDDLGADLDTEDENNKHDMDSPSKKQVKKKTKAVQMVTFDKQSLAPSFVADPPLLGDKVSVTITYCRRTDHFLVSNMTLVERNEPVGKAVQYNLCEGYILLEPVHTSFKDNNNNNNKGKRKGFEGGGGWDSDEKTMEQQNNSNEDGIILLLDDPAGLFKLSTNGPPDDANKPHEPDDNIPSAIDKPDSDQDSPIWQHIRYTLPNNGNRNKNADAPKRGDLVTFSKGKNGTAKDIRVVTKSAAEMVKGRLSQLDVDQGRATFHVTSPDENTYCIHLSQVVSCDVKLLKEDTPVEGILHQNQIVGICRTADLYLESAIGSGRRERPKLNLTVKKELQGLGGKIIAQSCMAKGPDGTKGFPSGWTTRISRYTDSTSNSAVPENPYPSLTDASQETDAQAV